jgi:hypothetical protein
MHTHLRAIAFVCATTLFQRCILPEVNSTDSAVSPATVAPPAPAASDAMSVVEAGPQDASAAREEVETPPMDAVPPPPSTPSVELDSGVMQAPAAKAPPAPLDAPCGSDGECQETLVCHNGLCKRTKDQPCTTDEECALEGCYRVCREPAKAGGLCDSQSDCVAPAFCKMNLCLLFLGESCEWDYQCTSGSCVDKQCVEEKGRLSSCMRDANCVAGLTCLRFRSFDGAPPADSYCEEPGMFPPNAFCTRDTECSSGTCGTGNFCDG